MKTRPAKKATSTSPKKNSAKKSSRNKHSRSTNAQSHPKRSSEPEQGVDGVRLQKYLAEAGVSSRRHAEKLITDGVVRVNGVVVNKLGTRVDPQRDRIEVSGKPVRIEEKALYLFHKPRQVVSTLSDPHARRSIKEFVKRIDKRIYPVGRLDYDVSGLLLLTNNGEFMERMLHPRFEMERVYWAEVRGVVSKSVLANLKKGIQLEDGLAKAESVSLLTETPEVKTLLGRAHDKTKFTLLEIVVAEGRNHFVKRLCSAAGHPVTVMSRVQFGQFQLGTLRAGELKSIPFPKFRD